MRVLKSAPAGDLRERISGTVTLPLPERGRTLICASGAAPEKRDATQQQGNRIRWLRSGAIEPARYATAPFSSASTSAAWPLGVTLSQIFRIVASGPIRYVIRTIPRNDLPRKVFMRRAPYASTT